MRLIVADDIAELETCAGHTQWLHGYLQVDPAVTLVDEEPVRDVVGP